MRSPVEESPEVKARRALKIAANAYAARYLTSFDLEEAENKLALAAITYAETTKPRRRKRPA